MTVATAVILAAGRGLRLAGEVTDRPKGFIQFGERPIVEESIELTLEDLIADTEDAILIKGRGSYSIDHQRYNFQFGGQTFHQIKKGKVVGMLRDVAYQSRTSDFWRSCDAIGGAPDYQLGGSFHDGKGEPSQSNAVSHGCAPARFRGIDVLNTSRKV